MLSSVGAFGLALAGAHLRLLPERDPHPRLYEALAVMLDCLDRPPLAGELMVRFELLILDELGFGLDLESCAATGTREELAYVSPKSGRAVSRAAGLPLAEKLFVLPAFLSAPAGTGADLAALEDAFRLVGHFLDRHLHGAREQALPEVRTSFINALRAGTQAVA
jgi:DNA repair protein RecO (recombination protein O)